MDGGLPAFGEPFSVGFSVGGFELGLIPDGTPGTGGAPKSLPRVRIATPKGAEGDATPGASVEWTVPKGSALKAAKAIRTALEADGWKESSGALDPLAGLLLLEKNDASITIDFTDTGFLPAELTIRASGCELEFR